MRMSLIKSLTMLCAVVAATTTARAEHIDLLMLLKDGELVTGTFDFDLDAVTSTGQRVYDGEFGGPFNLGGGVYQYTTDVPGFNALSSANVPAGFSALPGNSDVTFDIVPFDIDGTSANLWYWDGVGAVDFAPAASVTWAVSKVPSFAFKATAAGSNATVPGFTIDTTSPDGFLHKHLDFTLEGTGATAEDAIPSGFYALAMEFSVNPTSDPIYFIHGAGTHTEPQHEAAIEYFETNLVSGPAPGDFDADGDVDDVDIDQYIGLFGTAVPPGDEKFDLDGNNLIELADYNQHAQTLLGYDNGGGQSGQGTLFGDSNRDGSVTLVDLNTLGMNFGQAGGWSQGDSNGSGDITLVDLNALGMSFGQSVLASPSPSVPEPNALALVAGGALALWRRRERRN